MATKATLLVLARPNPDETAAVQEYLQGVMPVLQAAGGTLVKRLQVSEVIKGAPTAMAMVMDFESAAAITDVFESPDYAALVPVRDLGFADMTILVAENM